MDATRALAGENLKKMDMERLHTLLYQSRKCGEAQERLATTGAASFLQQGKWDDEWNALIEALNGYGSYGRYDHG